MSKYVNIILNDGRRLTDVQKKKLKTKKMKTIF